MRRVGEPSGDASRPPPRRASRRRGAGDLVAVHGRAGQVRGDGGRGDDRADVPDRVAPALVELAGLEDVVRERGARRAAETVISAVRAPALRAASRAAFVAAVPPSCETPMTRPLAGGIERQLEGLLGDGTGTGQPGRPDRARAGSRRRRARRVRMSRTRSPRPARPARIVSRWLAAAWRTALPGSARAAMIRRASAGSAAIMSVM